MSSCGEYTCILRVLLHSRCGDQCTGCACDPIMIKLSFYSSYANVPDEATLVRAHVRDLTHTRDGWEVRLEAPNRVRFRMR